MKKQYTIIKHGRRAARAGTYPTLDDAIKAAVTHHNARPAAKQQESEWTENPEIYRTTNVAKQRSVWGASTDNPHVGLSIWEEICVD